MRFFTPDLYERFNSPDDGEADRAQEEWEKALQAYRRHLDEFRDRMPSSVRKLAELCLHDAEVLSRVEEVQPVAALVDGAFPSPFPVWSAAAVLSLQQDGQIVSLFYGLWDSVRVQ